jgi:hypothetical protein
MLPNGSAAKAVLFDHSRHGRRSCVLCELSTSPAVRCDRTERFLRMDRRPNPLLKQSRRICHRRQIKSGCALLLLAASAGCDPAFQLKGTVKAPTGAPIAGARVQFSCQGVPHGPLLTTQPDGSFDDQGVGWFPDECRTRIDAAGYQPKDLAIGPYCRARPSHRRDVCVTVQIDATLEPRGTSRPPANHSSTTDSSP